MSAEQWCIITRRDARSGSTGRVYVVDVADRVPSYPPRFAFSSSEYHPEATRFPLAEAQELIGRCSWLEARLEAPSG